MNINATNATEVPSLSSTFRNVLPFAKRYAWRISISLAFMVAAGAVQLALPLGVRQLFDHMLSPNDSSKLNILAATLIGVFILRSVIGFIGQYILQVTGDRITNEIRVRLLRHYQNLPLDYHHKHRIGDFTSRLYSDASEVRNIVTNFAVSGTVNVVQLVATSVVMMCMNWQLGLIVLALGPLTTIVAKFFSAYFKQLAQQMKNALANAMSFAQELISGTHVVRIFSADGKQISRFEKMIDDYQHLCDRSRRIDAAYISIVTFLTVISTIALFWFGGIQVQSGSMTVGSLVAFFLYSQNVNQGISTLAQLFSSLSQSVGASAKVFELLSEATEEDDATMRQTFNANEATIEFCNVNFQYHDAIPILENISFCIRPGQTLAILGPSGIGKSSLLGLLPRFYEPTSGKILLNGIDISQYSLESLRNHISMVSQDIFLFSASVRENIRFGHPDATDEEVEKAAKSASAHEFIKGLKNGYNTEVGERGVQLSGGQRQRIAIARALLRDAPILILDEATSAVDSNTDSQIHEALLRLTKNRTTFVVAHRSSTIENADEVIHLDKRSSTVTNKEIRSAKLKLA